MCEPAQSARADAARAPVEDRPVPHGVLLTRLERADPFMRGSRDRGANSEADPTLNQAGRIGVHSVPRWIKRLLGTSLPVKLVGANVLLLSVAAATALVMRHRELSTAPVLAVVSVAYLVAFLLNTALVVLAVRPLRVLEKTVDTIWHGDLDARVPPSRLADKHVARVARMFNILLDGLVADRARTRRLATEIIDAGDRERAAISRELHDSLAQSLAAIAMQLGAAIRSIDDAQPTMIRERIEVARTLANCTMEEMRMLAHTMHPRVLDDLGLIAALKRLARDTADHSANYSKAGTDGAIAVEVLAVEGSDEALSAPVKSVLYRIAQEAVRNAHRHAAPRRIEIRLDASGEFVNLEVADDGCGFDLAATQREQTGIAGIGLFTMRERVTLVDGELRVVTRPGGGTSVTASIPLHKSASPSLQGGDK